ncbi:D-galactose 1-dehydrogenase [Palleronia aestuarii]|uniref:D-galactose 1-dehydrogenase n=1 Tax=Palleronia aestuarii TaxID=568105 RepID=A0A2W7NEV4_9RHOB|nr:Gfo/Idh/MocA family oxidoreductase [Palleronia aestuarii]PZX18450.1 D-galactose 1-dehydrogenase [Palleronia aestuarii]
MTADRRPIALAGIGKIARDRHIPALEDSEDWSLEATISRNSEVEGIESHADIESFLEARPDIDTISLALPPGPRTAYAEAAIRAGRNVMLEKPPARTMAECLRLEALAAEAGVTLFATWHSRMGHAVESAAARIREEGLVGIRIDWREDVRKTHPRQDWIWEEGSLGVFDPGINAFSILGEILDMPIALREVSMEIPSNRQTPIAADFAFTHPSGAEISGVFDFRHDGDPLWDMWIETKAGRFALRDSGSRLEADDGDVPGNQSEEYPLLYRRLAELVDAGESDFDLRPLHHTADAHLIGRRSIVEPFDW